MLKVGYFLVMLAPHATNMPEANEVPLKWRKGPY